VPHISKGSRLDQVKEESGEKGREIEMVLFTG